MENLEKIVGEVSEQHFRDFKLAKGICGAKNNGVALEFILDKAMPLIVRELPINKKKA